MEKGLKFRKRREAIKKDHLLEWFDVRISVGKKIC